MITLFPVENLLKNQPLILRKRALIRVANYFFLTRAACGELDNKINVLMNKTLNFTTPKLYNLLYVDFKIS